MSPCAVCTESDRYLMSHHDSSVLLSAGDSDRVASSDYPKKVPASLSIQLNGRPDRQVEASHSQNPASSLVLRSIPTPPPSPSAANELSFNS